MLGFPDVRREVLLQAGIAIVVPSPGHKYFYGSYRNMLHKSHNLFEDEQKRSIDEAEKTDEPTTSASCSDMHTKAQPAFPCRCLQITGAGVKREEGIAQVRATKEDDVRMEVG